MEHVCDLQHRIHVIITHSSRTGVMTTCTTCPAPVHIHACAEYWVAQGGLQQAHQLLERMRLTKVPLEPYVESSTVEAVYKVRLIIFQLCSQTNACRSLLLQFASDVHG